MAMVRVTADAIDRVTRPTGTYAHRSDRTMTRGNLCRSVATVARSRPWHRPRCSASQPSRLPKRSTARSPRRGSRRMDRSLAPHRLGSADVSFRRVRAAVVSAVLVSSLSACGGARTDLALARVCQGVRLGDPVRPTLVLFSLGESARCQSLLATSRSIGAPFAQPPVPTAHPSFGPVVAAGSCGQQQPCRE